MIEGTHLEHWINSITFGTFLSEKGTAPKRERRMASVMEPGGVIDKSDTPKTKKKKKKVYTGDTMSF